MKKVLIGISVFLLIITLLPAINSQNGLVRLWSYPRLQIAVLLTVTLIGWAFYIKTIKRYWLLVTALLISVTFQYAKIIPYTPVWKPEIVKSKKQTKETTISLLFYNVYMENKKIDKFIELAKEVQADLILLAEPDSTWQKGMQPLYAGYPYKVEVPLPNTYGMCLYSKLPLSETQVKFLVEPDIPSIHTKVTLPGGQQIKLYCIHPEPPGPKKSTKDRDAELVIVAKDITRQTLPVVVAGDLNDVAWSSTTKLFGEISKCNDPRVGRGLYSTFNARYPLLRWPLDHYFASREFTLNDMKRMRFIGSDHFPMFISLNYEPAAAGENKAKEIEEADIEKAKEILNEEKKED